MYIGHKRSKVISLTALMHIDVRTYHRMVSFALCIKVTTVQRSLHMSILCTSVTKYQRITLIFNRSNGHIICLSSTLVWQYCEDHFTQLMTYLARQSKYLTVFSHESQHQSAKYIEYHNRLTNTESQYTSV